MAFEVKTPKETLEAYVSLSMLYLTMRLYSRRGIPSNLFETGLEVLKKLL